MRKLAIVPLRGLGDFSIQRMLWHCLVARDVVVTQREYLLILGEKLLDGWDHYWSSLSLEGYCLEAIGFENTSEEEVIASLEQLYEDLLEFFDKHLDPNKQRIVDLMTVLPEGSLLLGYVEFD